MKEYFKKLIPNRRRGFPVLGFIILLCVAFTPEVTYAFFDFTDDILGGIARFFMQIFFILTGFFMTSGAFLLDFSITQSISTGLITAMPSVESAWGIIRDLANMFFIFIMLYIAVATILQIGNVQWKQALARLIIIALLINFSLFFTKVVIDASNMLAVGFYNNIQTTVTLPDKSTVPVYGPSTMLLGSMKLQTLFTASEWSKAGLTQLDIAMLFFYGSVFQAVAGFVFFTGTFMFLSRLVHFLFLMILSPIAFIAWILPNTGGYTTKWWKKLLENAFLAPAFLAMMYVVSTMLDDVFAISGADGASAFLKTIASGGTDGGYELFWNFFIVIGLMWGVIEVSKAISGGITQSSMKWAKRLTGAGVAGAAVAGGVAGRYTVGAAGKAASESDWLRERASRTGIGGSIARGSLNLTDKLGTSSFDVRKSRLGQAATSELGRHGFDTSAGQRIGEGGFKKNIVKQTTSRWRQADEKSSQLAATSAKTGDPIMVTDKKTGQTITSRESTARRYDTTAEKRRSGVLASSEARADYGKMAQRTRAGDKEAQDLKKRADIGKRKDEVKRIEQQIKSDPKQIEELIKNVSPKEVASFDPETLAMPGVAEQLDVRSLAAIAKSRDLNLTNAQRDAIREAATGGSHGPAVSEWFANNPDAQGF